MPAPGSGEEYHHPFSTASTKVHCAISDLSENETAPMSRSATSALPPNLLASVAFRPVASTSIRPQRFSGAPFRVTSSNHLPSALSLQELTRAERKSSVPASAAACASIESKRARSTCQPHPYGF